MKAGTPLADRLAHILETEIKALYPEYNSSSLLGHALARVRLAANPLAALRVLSDFTETLPVDDFLVFSGFDTRLGSALKLGTPGEDYYRELRPYYAFFDQALVSGLTFRADGRVFLERTGGAAELLPERSFPREAFDVLAKACGFGVKGLRPRAITDSERGLKISVSPNGGGNDPTPAILVRRQVPL